LGYFYFAYHSSLRLALIFLFKINSIDKGVVTRDENLWSEPYSMLGFSEQAANKIRSLLCLDVHQNESMWL
jgi:hypothetical protein